MAREFMTTIVQEKSDRIRGVFPDLELIAALLLLAAGMICAWPEIRGMAKTSLWQDELHSVERYSSMGPVFTITNYQEPNNHVFFNLLNSLTPGKERFRPLQARFWSFVFVALMVVGSILSHAADRRPLDGAVLAFLSLANISNLDLLLQARGYGFLAFAALACTLLAWQYFRRPTLIPLVGIPLMVWLGTWTVPTFIVFGAALFFVLLSYTRDWRWLPSGACSMIAIVVCYWPVRSELVHNSASYAGTWGKQFATWNAINGLFSNYLLFGMASWFTFLVAVVVTVGFCLSRIESSHEKAALCVGLSILLTLVLCLKLETPVVRSVAFTVVPFSFIAVSFFSKLFRGEPLGRYGKLSVASIIVLAGFVFALHSRQTFRFKPIEAWLQTADTIEDRFAKGTEIVGGFRAHWLKVYLSADYPFVRSLDRAKFIAGKQIVVDASFPPIAAFPVHELPNGYLTKKVPQRRGGKQRIYYSSAAQKASSTVP
jgi:hypothetical protein